MDSPAKDYGRIGGEHTVAQFLWEALHPSVMDVAVGEGGVEEVKENVRRHRR